jgi:formylglycine-generating enzyme required for sulfatase activity
MKQNLLQALPGSDENSNQTNAVSRLEKLAERMTKLEKEDRPQSVKEVLVELKRLVSAQHNLGRIFATPGVWITLALLVTLVIVLANIAPESDSDADQTAGSAVAPQPPPTAIAPFDAVQAKAHQTTWADHLGTPVETTNSIGVKLKLIPPGEFMMGSRFSAVEVAKRFGVPVGLSLDEHPRHRVTLTKPFYLGATEVTIGQFRQFVLAESYRTEAETDGKGGYGWPSATGLPEQNPKYNWKNCGFAQTDDHPVVNVSWNDAQAFCKWLSAKEGVTYRLPTEAEWEYACRAGTTTMYQTGDDPEGLVSVGNAMDASAKAKFTEFPASFFLKASDGYAFMAPVGVFRANPWGLHDMQGNVTEWCQDWAGEYPSGDVTDPMGAPQREGRVLRGGSFFSLATYLRSAARGYGLLPDLRNYDSGFRAARTYP